MASPSTDDDDEFVEYNPHPYQGGYDIALTYGDPLPPSPLTCYPISQGSGRRPDPELPPPVSGPLPEPYAPPPLPPPPPTLSGHLPESYAPLPLPPPPTPSESGHLPEPHHSPPPAEPDHHPEPNAPSPPESYDCGESDCRPVSHWPWPDFDNYGFWPYRTRGCRRCCAEVEDLGHWNQLKRAGEYIFGYSEGYGERRIGVDSYGIPIYANKKEDSEAVTVRIEPARDLKVECYESGNWFSSVDEEGNRSYGYNNDTHYYEEPLHAEENFFGPMLHQQLTYHEVYEDQVYPKSDWWSSFSEEKDKSYGYAYNKHHYEEALHVEENLIEPVLHQRLTCHEQSPYGECDDERDFYVNNQYVNERHHKEQPLCIELEPYKPTWSQNLNYVEFYGGELPLQSNHSLVDNVVVDESNVFGDPAYSYRRNYYEQPVCDELEPYKSTWAQSPTLYEPCMQEVSQSSWADDSKESVAQYFRPFLEDSVYRE